MQVLEDHARYELAEGRTPPTPDDDAQIAGAIHSALFGVGRLQPLIDDPEVENIDINGCDQVFVQYGDGREENPGPVAESDEELVELIQVLAAHAGLTSRPFASTKPSRSSTCDFRTAPGCPPSWVSPRARRCRSGRPAWARCSSATWLPTAPCPTTSGRSCGPRSRPQNIMIAGATNSGKTTLLRALANEIRGTSG